MRNLTNRCEIVATKLCSSLIVVSLESLLDLVRIFVTNSVFRGYGDQRLIVFTNRRDFQIGDQELLHQQFIITFNGSFNPTKSWTSRSDIFSDVQPTFQYFISAIVLMTISLFIYFISSKNECPCCS